ncbi:MAG: amidohydrolase family protein [Hyphomicrobiales bacterium]|nr:amidohydrolase family protein [Hyphomicrobiales bacterium]
MLTRRTFTTSLAALCATIPHIGLADAAGAMPQAPVAFDVPRGACDTHVHVIGDSAQFPMSPQRDYTPPAATVDDLRRMLAFLKLDRVVIVTPTIYNEDNSATLAAVKALGPDRARGIAMIDETAPASVLDALRDEGVAGFRLLMSDAATVHRDATAKRIAAAIDIAQARGWHIDIQAPPDVIAAVAPQLASSPAPLVFDYFGWLAGGLEQPGFDAVASLVKSGRAYVKLAEPYRLSKRAPDYNDLKPLVAALVAANPDRVMWGSGWPHVNSGSDGGHARTDVSPDLPVDTGHILNLLADWVPEAATRRKVLVDNPARLYGF